MEYNLRTRTKDERYHTIKLNREEWSTIRLIFGGIIKSKRPDIHLTEENLTPLWINISNYYDGITFDIEHEEDRDR